MTEYILFNYDIDTPIYISDDKQLLEEIMCDIFMEDAYNIFCEEVYDNPHIIPGVLAQDVWDDNLDFYNMYIGIMECLKI